MITLVLGDTSVRLDTIIYAIVPQGKRNALGRWRNSSNPVEIEVLPVRVTGMHLQSSSLPVDEATLTEEWTVEGFEYKKDSNPFSLRFFDNLRPRDCFTNIIEANVECVKRINKARGEVGVILEQCPECGEEVVIYNEGITPCPECGEPLAPCSVCGDCSKKLCPYGCTGIGDSKRLKPTNPVVPLSVQNQTIAKIVEECQLKRIRQCRMEAIRDFIRFEDSTATIFPWRTPAKEMLEDEDKLSEVMRKLKWSNAEYETEDLYALLDKTFGVNPEVNKE